MSDDKYDVVTDVLQKHYDKLWDMSKNKEDWGMMDFIRLEQMDQIKQAIKLWKSHLHQTLCIRIPHHRLLFLQSAPYQTQKGSGEASGLLS